MIRDPMKLIQTFLFIYQSEGNFNKWKLKLGEKETYPYICHMESKKEITYTSYRYNKKMRRTSNYYS